MHNCEELCLVQQTYQTGPVNKNKNHRFKSNQNHNKKMNQNYYDISFPWIREEVIALDLLYKVV